ncbi:MAG: propane 2-monooxygenase effector subunit MimD [Acidimicrobiales bacterium]
MTEFKVDATSSNMCGVTLMNNRDGHEIAQLMDTKPGVTVTHFPSMIRVDGKNKLDFDFDEIGDALGYGDDFTQANFEEVISTHYGRMVNLDDRTLFFANPEDAAEYLDFDLQAV